MLPAGDSWMEWTLRLVGMGIDGQSRSFDVMAISRPDGLGDIANLGITLSEAKQLLVRVQQQVVVEQANTHATFRPDCHGRLISPLLTSCSSAWWPLCSPASWRSRRRSPQWRTIARFARAPMGREGMFKPFAKTTW